MDPTLDPISHALAAALPDLDLDRIERARESPTGHSYPGVGATDACTDIHFERRNNGDYECRIYDPHGRLCVTLCGALIHDPGDVSALSFRGRVVPAGGVLPVRAEPKSKPESLPDTATISASYGPLAHTFTHVDGARYAGGGALTHTHAHPHGERDARGFAHPHVHTHRHTHHEDAAFRALSDGHLRDTHHHDH